MSLFDYSDEEIQAVKPGHLLSMEIEFTRRCNYRCPYCYAVDESMDYSTEMSPEEIRRLSRSFLTASFWISTENTIIPPTVIFIFTEIWIWRRN